MKIVGITMITRPDYRQDPWREAVRQALELCHEVVIVYGSLDDGPLVGKLQEEYPDRIMPCYVDWPQPEWTYDELPRHLNAGLKCAREMKADWIYKFDTDYFIHEEDIPKIVKTLTAVFYTKEVLCQIEKRQLFLVDRYYQKGKIPIFVKGNSNIWYGKDENRYTDLCQPIEWLGDMFTRDGLREAIKSGKAVTRERIVTLPGAMYNYDYSFKTLERSKELLFHFDRSHATFWGAGYHGLKYEDITPETALADYLELAESRVRKCVYKLPVEKHPKHIQDRVKNIKPEEFGSNLWGKIKYDQ